jgi:hypothetical protein
LHQVSHSLHSFLLCRGSRSEILHSLYTYRTHQTDMAWHVYFGINQSEHDTTTVHWRPIISCWKVSHVRLLHKLDIKPKLFELFNKIPAPIVCLSSFDLSKCIEVSSHKPVVQSWVVSWRVLTRYNSCIRLQTGVLDRYLPEKRKKRKYIFCRILCTEYKVNNIVIKYASCKN